MKLHGILAAWTSHFLCQVRVGHACQTRVSDTILLFSMYFSEFDLCLCVVSCHAGVVMSMSMQHSMACFHIDFQLSPIL